MRIIIIIFGVVVIAVVTAAVIAAAANDPPNQFTQQELFRNVADNQKRKQQQQPPSQQQQQQQPWKIHGEAEDPATIGLSTSKLARQRYCVEESEAICGVAKDSSPDEFTSNRKSPVDDRDMSLAECLEDALLGSSSSSPPPPPPPSSSAGNQTCANFLRGRKQCLRDMLQSSHCAALRPGVEIAARYRKKMLRLESRRGRLQLRDYLRSERGLGRKRSVAQKSRSLSRPDVEEANDEQLSSSSSSREASPSQSAVAESDAGFIAQQAKIEARMQSELAKVNSSSKAADVFLTICSAILSDQSGLSDGCTSSALAQKHLFFGDVSFASFAARKIEIYRRRQKDFSREAGKNKKLLSSLKERMTRHAVSDLDEKIENAEQSMSAEGAAASATKDAGSFLLKERRDRERRRRLNVQKVKERLAKDRRAGVDPHDPVAVSELRTQEKKDEESELRRKIEERKRHFQEQEDKLSETPSL